MNRGLEYRLSDLPQGEVAGVVGYAFNPLVIGAIAPRLGARIRLTSRTGGHLTLRSNEEYRILFWGGQSMTSNEEGLDDLGAVGRILVPTSEGHSLERLGVSITSYPHPTTPCGSDKSRYLNGQNDKI